ncbi:DUF4041 domain-containing protein [Roseateles sp. BYS180W]|uniref:DUF4041 domain-containing protein n=1 Tax=Roseateles rivi TaxID=3299028 RepID=A0ABW7FR24_9BURK
MALRDYWNGPKHRLKAESLERELGSLQSSADELQKRYETLEEQQRQSGLLTLLEIQKAIQSEEHRLAQTQANVLTAQAEVDAAVQRLKDVQNQILVAEDVIELESFALYVPKYQLTNSAEYKARLDAIREEQKESARGLSKSVDQWDHESVRLTKTEWKQLRKDVLKLALRAFNSESEYCIDNVKFNNVDRMEERIRRSFAACNKLLNQTSCWWTDVVLGRKLEELHLAHEFQTKRAEEKEMARQAREEQREQEKLEREIREARAKIEKERRHFAGAMQKLQLRLADTQNGQEREELLARLTELEQQKGSLDEEERLLDYREQNARAGYVYVISNIGAFGEGVYKIGMTRRLEPMERIDELGDASVPFRFDVHALVFSDNAPALEAKLHAHFAAGRMNKVNGRKEFFRADLKDIEAVIRANYDAVVEVVHAAPAEQYRESLRMTMPSESIQAAEMAAAIGALA